MENKKAVKLKDGRTLELEVLTYPIDLPHQNALIGLWRTEWTHGDYDWLRSMNGDYSRHLRIQAALGTIEGRPAGTASVCYPCQGPEVSVVGSVLTHRDYRRLGVAEAMTNAVVDLSYQAGCRVSYLGATRDPRNVYLRCGFRWWNGGVMRREREDSSRCEDEFFAPGQSTSIRESNWGDLPGFACFVVQPWNSRVLDYQRALLSGKYVKLQRCVSNFPVVDNEVIEPGGAMGVLVGQTPHRVLGFGSITPEPGEARRHKAMVDVCSHDGYGDQTGPLIYWFDGAGCSAGHRVAPSLCRGLGRGQEDMVRTIRIETRGKAAGTAQAGGRTS